MRLSGALRSVFSLNLSVMSLLLLFFSLAYVVVFVFDY